MTICNPVGDTSHYAVEHCINDGSESTKIDNDKHKQGCPSKCPHVPFKSVDSMEYIEASELMCRKAKFPWGPLDGIELHHRGHLQALVAVCVVL